MPAKRAYGMDQDFYPWSPIVARPILRWPDDARVALAVIVNLEHWDWEVPADTPVAVSPLGGPEGLSWIIDDQPWPINVRGGHFVPYTGQTNDAAMLAWNREADYFQQTIKDQFDTLYREGAENGRVMCLALHPHNIGRPNAAKHLDEALTHILGHDGVWATTADDIAEYYIANCYDQVKSWIAERKTGT
jgi:hypothetical protein